MVRSLLQLMEVVMQHALLVVPGHPSGLIVSSAGDCFTLEELQGHVGGYVELVELPRFPSSSAGEAVVQGRIPSTDLDCLLVDEDGQMKGLELNQLASVIAGAHIAGPALLANLAVLK